MKEKAFISIILYIYNNEKNIENSILKIDQFLLSHFESAEIIILNNGSSDRSSERLKELHHLNKIKSKMTLVHLSWKHNKEVAMQAALDLAIGDFVYEIDNIPIDFSVSLLMELLQKANTGYDLVSAVAQKRKKVTSSLFYRLLKKLSSIEFELETEMVRLMSRRLINSISTVKDKLRYRKVLYRYSGLPYAKVIYKPTKIISIDTQPTKDRLELGFEVLFSYSQIGVRISIYLSVIFLFGSLFSAGYTIYIYFSGIQVVQGWTTTMALLSFGFSGIFLIMGLKSKYLSMILNEIRTMPSYTIKSIERL